MPQENIEDKQCLYIYMHIARFFVQLKDQTGGSLPSPNHRGGSNPDPPEMKNNLFYIFTTWLMKETRQRNINNNVQKDC